MRQYLYPVGLLFAICLGPAGFAKVNNKFFQNEDAWFLKYLSQQYFPIDSGANAIILYEQTSYDLETELTLNGAMNREVHQIIKVLRPGGISFGDQTIIVPHNGKMASSISNIRAVTYVLRDGKLEAHKLDAATIAKNRTDYFTQVKFAMPAVQPGAILDISYKVKGAPALLFAQHDFQHEIPTLYSELELFIPLEISYLTVNQGSMNSFPEFDDRSKSVTAANLPEAYMLSVGETDIMHRRWVRRNIPAVSEEPYTPNVANFMERLLLRINGVQAQAFSSGIMDTWKKLHEYLMDSYSFYQATTHNQQTLGQLAEKLTKGVTDPEKKARILFSYIRNTMSADGNSGIFTRTDMGELLKNQSATPSEINLMLFAMLRNSGINAHPLLITTKEDHSAIKDLPDLTQFTRTICQVNVGGKVYDLDASCKQNAFGQLQEGQYNGYARVITAPEGKDHFLESSGLKERQLVSITTENAAIDQYTLKVTCQFGPQAAARRRLEWAKDTGKIRSMALASLRNLGSDATIGSCEVLGLRNPDTSLVLQYLVRLNWSGAASVYLNPHVLPYFPENPFKSSHRSLPVEMPSTFDVYYNVQMQVPEGYKLDDAPKPQMITLGTQDNFKYMHSYDPASNSLKISSRIHLERTWFPLPEYESLQQFFDKIVESQQRSYVFTKS